jgi:hypothetical protein
MSASEEIVDALRGGPLKSGRVLENKLNKMSTHKNAIKSIDHI